MEKWLIELNESGIDLDKLSQRDFADAIKIIGFEAAYKLFEGFHGVDIYVGSAYRRDLMKQYLRKFSFGKTEKQLAMALRTTKSNINRLLNESPILEEEKKKKKKNNGYIPMFPELERDKPEE